MCQHIKARKGYHLRHGERYLNIYSKMFCIKAYLSRVDESVMKEAYDSLWKSKKKTLEDRVKEAEKRYRVKIEILDCNGNSLEAKKICLTISAQ